MRAGTAWRWLAVLAIAVIAPAWIWHSGWRVPDRWNPWAPLDIAAEPDLFVRYKLGRLDRDATACRTALQQAGMKYESVADRTLGEGCALSNAVRIVSSEVRWSSAFTLSCRAAASLALWERHGVVPASERTMRSRVVRIDHLGSLACRNVGGATQGRRSRHATADALDVAAFHLADGRRIRVADAWSSSRPEGSFLREVHAGACRFFDGVLGPDYDAAHRDHFHLERGGFGVCR